MVNISYTNARGETVILDSDESTALWELYGREGCEAPELEYKEVTYADGTTETLLVRMKPRDVVLYFNVLLRNGAQRSDFETLKTKLIQTGTREGNWGRLMIRRTDGTEAYLNCVYTGGLDDIVRRYPTSTKFSLVFHAQDPLFHNADDTQYVIAPDDASGWLYLQPDDDPLYMAALTFTGGTYTFAEDNSTDNPNGVYMKSANAESHDEVTIGTQTVYPTIMISGTARNIRLINQTTGKKIEFAASVTVTGKYYVLIETKPLHRKAVRVNVNTGAATNIAGKLTADSTLDFPLERGTNVILFRNSEATPESLCTLTYMEGYLSAE